MTRTKRAYDRIDNIGLFSFQGNINLNKHHLIFIFLKNKINNLTIETLILF